MNDFEKDMFKDEQAQNERLKQTEAEADRLLSELKALSRTLEDERERVIGGWSGLVLRQDDHEEVVTRRARHLYERIGRMLIVSLDDFWSPEEQEANRKTVMLAARDAKAVIDKDNAWKRESKRIFREELVKLGAPDVVTNYMFEVDCANALTDRVRKIARKAADAYLDACGRVDVDDAPESP